MHTSFKSFLQMIGKLKLCIKSVIFLYSDLVSWVTDMDALIVANELAKDMSGAESLLQRHQERKVN